MSGAPSVAGTAARTDGPAASAASPKPARRRRGILVAVLAAVLLLAALVTTALASASAKPSQAALLNPDDTGPAGGKALVEVLKDHHVRVHATDSLAATRSQLSAHPDATVLLFDTYGSLDSIAIKDVRESAARLLWISPAQKVLPEVDQQFSHSDAPPPGQKPLSIRASCSNTDAAAAGRIRVDVSQGVYATAGVSGPLTCFSTPGDKDGGGDTPSEAAGGIMASTTDGNFTVLSSAAPLSNGSIAEEGNAALALRLLGHQQDLIWYTPGLADVPASGQVSSNPFSYLPPWFTALSAWLLVLATAVILWAVRRHGPVVTEPLPVNVKAAETAFGRAKLYQSGRAVDAAVVNLRSAALASMARALRLDRDADAGAVCAAAARASGWPEQRLTQLLVHPQVSSEAALVQWARDVAAVKEALNVHRP